MYHLDTCDFLADWQQKSVENYINSLSNEQDLARKQKILFSQESKDYYNFYKNLERDCSVQLESCFHLLESLGIKIYNL